MYVLDVRSLSAAFCAAAALLSGCDAVPADPNAHVRFHDDVAANVSIEDDLATLRFHDAAGREVELKDLLGEKHVVLVVTRGYSGAFCIYCSTQTTRLIANYPKFAERDAEVVVVFPLETPEDGHRRDEFLDMVRRNLADPQSAVPFPVLLDVELQAVDRLGIRKALAKPATYILDRRGNVRFAYVGETISDRPSIAAMLKQLDEMRQP